MFPLIMLSLYKMLVAKGLRKIASLARVSALEEILPQRSRSEYPKYSEVLRGSRRALGVPT